MNDEQLYKESFEELSLVLSDAMKNNAMLKAQAEFYISKGKALFEENEQLRKENQKLVDENNELKEDLRKLEGEPDPHTTEENK